MSGCWGSLCSTFNSCHLQPVLEKVDVELTCCGGKGGSAYVSHSTVVANNTVRRDEGGVISFGQKLQLRTHLQTIRNHTTCISRLLLSIQSTVQAAK